MMKKIVGIVLPLLMIMAFGLAACGQSSTGAQPGTPANEVDMGIANFVQTSVTISKGQSVHFVDQQSGTTHILCIGKDGSCNSDAKGPRDLIGQGFTVQPGQAHDVPFDTAGTYTITCTLHPDMNLSVTVR
jgi:plastocyanin